MAPAGPWRLLAKEGSGAGAAHKVKINLTRAGRGTAERQTGQLTKSIGPSAAAGFEAMPGDRG